MYQPSQPKKLVIKSMVSKFVDRVFDGSPNHYWHI